MKPPREHCWCPLCTSRFWRWAFIVYLVLSAIALILRGLGVLGQWLGMT